MNKPQNTAIFFRILKPGACIILLMVAVVHLTACLDRAVSSDHPRPNIIIVMTDDQGFGDLGCHGNPYIKTPQIDTFAEQALELTNFHVGTTCTPTRAGLITGRNANRNNAWHTIAGCSILLEDEQTLAEIFANNGYNTAMFGKWHLGDNYPYRPHDRGFHDTFYHGGGGVGQTPDFWNNNYFDDTYFRNGKPEKTSGYCTDIWFDEAIAYIDKAKETPFLLYLAPNAAHSPYNVPEEFVALYDNAPLTPMQKRFYGMVSNIDYNFGRLVAHLKKSGKYNNTILIFTTDNGTALGISTDVNGKVTGYNSGLRGIKGSHYDGGHKVPFFINWPLGNLLKNTDIDQLVGHVDLLPTLVDLANIPYIAAKPLDGANMADILRGKQPSVNRMLVIDTQRNQFPLKGLNSCVMDTEWRLIDGKELYHTASDPGQKHDVARMYPNVVAKMQSFYDDWWESILPDIRHAEIPLGDKHTNEVLINVHDLHTTENIPWNQAQVRMAEFMPDGHYLVKLMEKGQYRFRLFRYPPEAGLALGATAPKITGSSTREELPGGKPLQPIAAEVAMGNTVLKVKVDAELPFASLEGTFEKGSYQLKSTFLNVEGRNIPAYYTEITKL